ncbi:U2 snRNP-associated SURP motif-containing protein-like [Watersipora subatra]|uniref:U2 snRNP-associated SURP motif-containing protein-like n=1 Tax=Watersipora subatra TaxID=2589382 RepID=UPI00355C9478
MATKRKLEEQRKKEEEERLAAVHKDFLDSFSDAPKLDKTWVRAGTAETERTEKKGETQVKREIYKPKSKLPESAFKPKEETQPREEHVPSKPKKNAAKKSNLEIFKEELRAMQMERDERRKLRSHIKECEEQGIAPTLLTSRGRPSRFEATLDVINTLENTMEKDIYGSSMSKGPNYENDMTTTNIYCGNIAPKMNEQDLCELFGKYGPLASVKIMYPRTDEERAKNRHTGFVGFMKRSDAEDAFDGLKGETVMSFEMKLSWGKPIPIPPRPIYIPPSMIKETQPPPPSGLPFNAQPLLNWEPERDRYGNADLTKNLDLTEVKIVIPTDRMLLCLIHRMVEYVVREGPLFEAMIMNKEMSNPRFRFLFDNQTPAHTYYRWKLFTILQGDEPHIWRIKPFQMFEGGSLWLPPKMNPYMQKQMKDGSGKGNTSLPSKKQSLSERQRDRLGDLLRELTTDRVKIGETMIWCLEHAESADEIVETVVESLSILDTPLPRKLARLYLVSDILNNSSAKLPNVSYYRKYFETALLDIFKSFHEAYNNIEGRLAAENFKQKVMNCFRIWEEWVIYPLEHLIKCQNLFLGLFQETDPPEEENVDGAPLSPNAEEPADVDGEPIEQGSNFDGEIITSRSNGDTCEEDIDGAPVCEDIDGNPLEVKKEPEKPKFAASKWESVDENTVKAQAMTTSKWELLEESTGRQSAEDSAADDIDGAPINSRESSPADDNDLSKGSGLSGLSALSAAYTPKEKKSKLEMTERRRSKLRDIEVKVVKYQDELEAGRRSRKSHMSISEQVKAYRQKLLQKEQDEAIREQANSSNDSRSERKRRYNDRSRSPSPRHRYRSRSRTPERPRTSRSRRSRSPRRTKRSRSRSSDRYSRHKKNRY